MYIRRKTKEIIDLEESLDYDYDVFRIKSTEDLIEYEYHYSDKDMIEINEEMLSNKDIHTLFFLGKEIILELSNLDNINDIFLNPMISYIKTDEELDIDSINNVITDQRDIENVVCHINVGKIHEKYNDKHIGDILEPVWNHFMVYNIYNVPEFDHIKGYEEVAEKFGTIRLCHPVNDKSTNFSKSRDIKYNPDIYHYFASNTRQPLHTDYAYYREGESPDWLILYCQYPSEWGGITSLISTKTMSKILSKYNPELLEKIKIDVTYKYNGEDGDKIHDIFLYDGKFINWNYWQIKEEFNDEKVMEVREEFFRFLEDVLVDGSIYDVSKEWNPRDCVIFNDHLVLHGRSAFLGDRWLKDHAFYKK
jgi:alpha-ketoglutarate-dependent taurine dioxygenase